MLSFKLFRSFFLIIFASTFLLAEDSKFFISVSQSPTHEIFNTTYKQINILIPMIQEGKLDEAIFTIQNKIREIIVDCIEKKMSPQIVLYAKGFDATLMAIAQTNLLPEYRYYISGIILEDAMDSLPQKCTLKEDQTICTLLEKFKIRVGSRSSFIEMSKALSPSLQMDWYWPTVLLISNSDEKKYYYRWETLLDEHGIDYEFVYLESLLPSKAETHKAFKIQSFLKHLKKPSLMKSRDLPSYFGSILQFHLGKILYKSKHKLQKLENIAYGDDVQQQYDVYFKKDSKQNPLFIYVHGGGWNQGDRKSFEALCQQYADKGYTAISIDYRLHDLPKVGMKEMVLDVSSAIEKILKNASRYHADANQTVVMAESAGAQLAFMGIHTLAKKRAKQIKAVLLNSVTANLRHHSQQKQIRLSGIKSDAERKSWLDRYSPVNQLENFYIPIFAMHSMSDYVVPAVHLDELLFQAHKNNRITPLWISNGVHPIAPNKKSLEPSYRDIERKIDMFIKKHLKIETTIKP